MVSVVSEKLSTVSNYSTYIGAGPTSENHINKEDLAFSTLKTALDLNEYLKTHKSATEKTYLFVDEIQDIVDFHLALRSLLLDEQMDIYCTGSNANMLSSDIAGFLSGRYIEITVYSLSYI